MNSLEVNTIVRVTSDEGLTPEQMGEILQRIQKGQWPVGEPDNGAGATSPVDHAGKNGLIILQTH